MARFAKIDENHLVVSVVVINNKELLDENNQESEAKGIEFLNKLYGDISPMYWKQTSYNTHCGKHTMEIDDPDHEGWKKRVESNTPEKALRKNFAAIGHSYDSQRDAFIPPRPQKSNGSIVHHSWNFNEDTCIYDPPLPHPDVSDPGSTKYTDENGVEKTMVFSWDEHVGRWLGAYKDEQPDETLMMYYWDYDAKQMVQTEFTRAEFLDITYTGVK